MATMIGLGTRPELIRLFHTVKAVNPDYLFWTGQNFAPNLSTEIMEDPRFEGVYNNMTMHNTGNAQEFKNQFGSMLEASMNFMEDKNITKLLILGDTNSSLALALAARKLGIPIYHMEAGNRCHDYRSPEETNRRMIDSIADVHLCYTTFAKQNLLDEGVASNRIHVTGNPMAEFSELFKHDTDQKRQVLITLHRAENWRYISKLKGLFSWLQEKGLEVVPVLHPRYLKKFQDFGAVPSVNFSDFVRMQQESALIITDSGTVCEEAAMLRKPCLVARRTMERPELLESGSTILGRMDDLEVLKESCETLLSLDTDWEIPDAYLPQKVSQKVRTIFAGGGNFV